MKGGLSPTTPIAIIEQASTNREWVTKGSLSQLGTPNVLPPAIIVVGRTAALSLRDIESTT